MYVIEVFGNNFGVVEAHGKLVASGFQSAADAYDWIEIYQHPERKDEVLRRQLKRHGIELEG